IGMTTSTIYASEAQSNPNMSKSYKKRRKRIVLHKSYDFDGDGLAPSGILKSNVVEMSLFVSAELGRGIAPNGTRVVSEQNLTETWITYLDHYGMGWDNIEHRDVTVIWHTGAYDEFTSVIGFLPDLNYGFVILANCDLCDYKGANVTGNAHTAIIDHILDY
ncbi:MAG: serine hydrolase, partial [Pseudanabaenales cyanobacterium]|nr:serine hydrolase [Pseudanabaenales cyanobacterium]